MAAPELITFDKLRTRLPKLDGTRKPAKRGLAIIGERTRSA
jgi:hypothetical protein